MDLGFKRYQETLRRTARGYLEKACSLENLRAADASEAGFSLEHYREMAALGWFALALPAAAGGGEDDFLNALVLYEEFGRTSCRPSSAPSSSPATAAPPRKRSWPIWPAASASPPWRSTRRQPTTWPR